VSALRILIVADHCFPASGTLTYLSRVLDVHRRNGIQTALLVEREAADPEFLARLEREGVPVYAERHRSALFRKSYFSIFWDIASSWRAVRAFRPDLILVSSGNPYLHIGLFVYRAPVAYVVHSYPRLPFRRGTRLFLRIARSKKNRILTVSRFAAARIHEYMGVPAEKIEVIYNSYREVPPPAAQRRRCVLTVGQVVDYKNPGVWLDVAERVTRRDGEVEFVWVGDGPLLAAMRKEADARGLSPRVRFDGARADVSSLYAQAMVYVQPSRVENHALSVVEAMAHGLPCVTSNAGGLPESVLDGVTGFTVDPDDTDGFCHRIHSLLDDSVLRAAMGLAGRERARQLFSPETQEARLLETYRSMCGSGGDAEAADAH